MVQPAVISSVPGAAPGLRERRPARAMGIGEPWRRRAARLLADAVERARHLRVDHHMGGDAHDRLHTRGMTGGMRQRDARAVARPDHERALDAPGPQQFLQALGLALNKIARQHALPIAPLIFLARVGDAGAALRRAQKRREPAP